MARILVIDDSKLMRSMWRAHLEEAGFEVDDFLPNSADEVIERVNRFLPDLILSDFNMPKINGYNVARAARHSNPKIIIIILTATRDNAMDAMLKSIGVRKIIYKPIRGEDLVATVTSVLEAHQKR